MHDNQMWVVSPGEGSTFKCVVWAGDREDAKRKARTWLARDPDHYICTPVTNPGDKVKVDITLNV